MSQSGADNNLAHYGAAPKHTGQPKKKVDGRTRRKKPERSGTTFLRKIKIHNPPEAMRHLKDYFEDLLPEWLIRIESETLITFSPHEDYYRDPQSGDYIWRPLDITVEDAEDSGLTYGIYYTLVNSMDYLQRLIIRTERCNSEKAEKMRKMMLKLQDRFQPLSLYMELTEKYDDSSLLDASFELTEEDDYSAFDLFFPRDSLSFDIEELPDMFVHVLYCRFWGEKDKIEVPFDSPIDRKLIDILTKAQPSPCKGRSLATIISNAWSDKTGGSIIFDSILRIIFGGLLGVYDHCTVLPNFRVRRILYHWFSFSSHDRNIMADWISQNKTLITYILREFLFFSIMQCSPLNDFMEKTYYWYSMRRNACDAMDNVRKYLNSALLGPTMIPAGDCSSIFEESCVFLEANHIAGKYEFWFEKKLSPEDPRSTNISLFLSIEDTLAEYNRRNLKYCPRHIETSFVEKMDTVIAMVDIETALKRRRENKGDKIQETISDEDLLKEIAAGISSDSELITEYEREYVERLVTECHDPINPISYEWLAAIFDVSLYDSIMPLKEAETLYKYETDRTALKKVMQEIMNTSPRDYEFLKTFFLAMHKVNGIAIYDLPATLGLKQIQKYREVYGLEPGQELPESAGTYYVCPNCSRIKAPVIPAGSDAIHRQNEHSLCSQNIAYDILDEMMYCKKIQNKKASPKKNTQNQGLLDMVTKAKTTEMKRIKKICRDERRKIPMRVCPHTQLKEVNLIGRLLCTRADGPIMVCPECIVLTTLYREGFKNPQGTFSCGCILTKSQEPPNVRRCIMCDPNKPQKEPPIHSHLVYNDEIIPTTVKYLPFCKKHACSWIERWNIILPLSTIRKAYDGHWTSIVIDRSTGERMFLDKKDNKYSHQGKRR